MTLISSLKLLRISLIINIPLISSIVSNLYLNTKNIIKYHIIYIIKLQLLLRLCISNIKLSKSISLLFWIIMHQNKIIPNVNKHELSNNYRLHITFLMSIQIVFNITMFNQFYLIYSIIKQFLNNKLIFLS